MTTLSFAVDVLAQAKGGQQGSGLYTLVIMGGLFAAMYFLMLRPQRKARAEHTSLMRNLKQGDKVVALGGVHATVRRVDDDTISLQVADNVVIKVDKSAVQKVLTRA